MQRSTTLLLIVLFLSLSINIAIFVNNQQLQQNTSQTQELMQSVKQYLSVNGDRCTRNVRYAQDLTDCLSVLTRAHTVLSVKETDYEPNSTGGYLVLLNKDKLTLNSTDFSLYKNQQLQDSACQVPGAIKPSFVCRLDWSGSCGPGDVLEVRYLLQSVYVKAC